MEYEYSFEDVQMTIDGGKIEDAENMLMSLQTHPDQARWNYLMSVVYMKKGWLEYGTEYARKAAELEPDNQEYKAYYDNAVEARKSKDKKEAPRNALRCCVDLADCCKCCGSLSECLSK